MHRIIEGKKETIFRNTKFKTFKFPTAEKWSFGFHGKLWLKMCADEFVSFFLQDVQKRKHCVGIWSIITPENFTRSLNAVRSIVVTHRYQNRRKLQEFIANGYMISTIQLLKNLQKQECKAQILCAPNKIEESCLKSKTEKEKETFKKNMDKRFRWKWCISKRNICRRFGLI